MKIDGRDSVSRLLRAYAEQSQRAQTGAAERRPEKTESQTDSLQLSDQARQMLQAREAVTKVPDVRQDKVSELRRGIEQGTYKPDYELIARRLLSRFQADGLPSPDKAESSDPDSSSG